MIITIGSTSKFRNQINWDKDKGKEKEEEKNTSILTNDNYICMNDVYNVGIDFYSHWELEHEQVMTKMTESKNSVSFNTSFSEPFIWTRVGNWEQRRALCFRCFCFVSPNNGN